jgi:hypothetical protein
MPWGCALRVQGRLHEAAQLDTVTADDPSQLRDEGVLIGEKRLHRFASIEQQLYNARDASSCDVWNPRERSGNRHRRDHGIEIHLVARPDR